MKRRNRKQNKLLLILVILTILIIILQFITFFSHHLTSTATASTSTSIITSSTKNNEYEYDHHHHDEDESEDIIEIDETINIMKQKHVISVNDISPKTSKSLKWMCSFQNNHLQVHYQNVHPYFNIMNCSHILNTPTHTISQYQKKQIFIIIVHVSNEKKLQQINEKWINDIKYKYAKYANLLNLQIHIETFSSFFPNVSYFIEDKNGYLQKNRFEKTKKVINYLMKKYENKFDWIYKMDDDSYLYAYNFLEEISTFPKGDKEEPYFISMPFSNFHPSGGAGYFMNSYMLKYAFEKNNKWKCQEPFEDKCTGKWFRNTFPKMVFYDSLSHYWANLEYYFLEFYVEKQSYYMLKFKREEKYYSFPHVVWHWVESDLYDIFEKIRMIKKNVFQFYISGGVPKNIKKCKEMFINNGYNFTAIKLTGEFEGKYGNRGMKKKKNRKMENGILLDKYFKFIDKNNNHDEESKINFAAYYFLMYTGGIYINSDVNCDELLISEVDNLIIQTYELEKFAFFVEKNADIKIIGGLRYSMPFIILMKDLIMSKVHNYDTTGIELIRKETLQWPINFLNNSLIINQ